MTQFRTPIYVFTDGTVDQANERTLVVLKLLREYGFVVEALPVETIEGD